MHGALEVHDVVLLIVDAFGPPNPVAQFGDRNTHDLAVLARVSRTFSESALDALWRELRNPPLLFSLVPDKHNITANEWSLFQFYARRIRSLIARRTIWMDPLFSRSLLATKSKPLLPSLQRIS
ncbi:hypothetical protein OBBRIDRAFT_792087 [Obba rivulosa]|uniref:Uncharacterized protein n=1 Tax=Obba rivulosa TaxID=1052685 RepID=A0A8E2AWG2_9APHY|nr:hypothetical protein OBBRIDRAFT_792087 [Obba rivulosa]